MAIGWLLAHATCCCGSSGGSGKLFAAHDCTRAQTYIHMHARSHVRTLGQKECGIDRESERGRDRERERERE